MQGERSSVFKSFFLNPRILIGLVLTMFTLSMDYENPFELFFEPDVYRNLAIGSAVYVGLFGRKYTEGMEHLDWGETLMNVLETMVTIFLFWFGSLFLVANYQRGGESYSDLLRARYREARPNAQNENSGANTSRDIVKTLQNMDVKSGQRYRIIPNEDGSVTIEVE